MLSKFSTEKNYVFGNVFLKFQSIACFCYAKSSLFLYWNNGGFCLLTDTFFTVKTILSNFYHEHNGIIFFYRKFHPKTSMSFTPSYKNGKNRAPIQNWPKFNPIQRTSSPYTKMSQLWCAPPLYKNTKF